MLGDRQSVSQRVTDAVVAVGWLWVFALLWALPIAMYATLYVMVTTGRVPNLGPFATAINPALVVVAAAGGLAVFVLWLANATFGTENVEAGLEQAQDIHDEAEK